MLSTSPYSELSERGAGLEPDLRPSRRSYLDEHGKPLLTKPFVLTGSDCECRKHAGLGPVGEDTKVGKFTARTLEDERKRYEEMDANGDASSDSGSSGEDFD